MHLSFFFAKIESYLGSQGDERQDRIRNLVEALTENFYMLEVRTESLWLAYRLFETLNERGLDLSQADLIRNKLLEHAREEGVAIVSKVADLWTELTDSYEEQAEMKLELPQIIQFSYTSRHSVVKKEDIFDRVSEDLLNGKVSAEEFAFQFRRDSQGWSSFLLGDLRNWTDKLADSQYAIIDPLWKDHSAPFIFAAMEAYSDDRSTLEKLFLLAEHYLFRQGLVCKDSVGTLQTFFGNAAYLLRSGLELEEMSALFKRHSSTRTFVDNFKSFSVKNMKQGFYAMWKIESFLTEQRGIRPKNQSAAQHLEHIMPRKPGNNWDGIEKSDDFKPYLNRLGNLMILTRDINQHIKSSSIEYKMSNKSGIDYKNSEMKVALEFMKNFDEWSNNGKWTFRSIESRQAYLADTYADKVWSLDLD